MMGFQRQKSNILPGILYITIIVTVLSQIDALPLVRPLMYGCWIVLVGFLVASTHGLLPKTKFNAIFLTTFFIFIFYCLICSLFKPAYLSNHYLRTMVIPLLVTIVGSYLYNTISTDEIYKLCCIYTITSLIFAIYIHFTYFASYQSWLSNNEYIFAQKNSAAQIWCTGVLIIYFIILPKSKNKAFWIIASIYLLFISAISQCRTALLAMIVVLIYNVLVNTRKKILWIGIIVCVFLILYRYPTTRTFFDHVFLVDKYNDANFNTMSSGRLDLWKAALIVFENNVLIGSGSYYVDSSYVLILAESGIIGFLLIENIWIRRIGGNFIHSITSFSKRHFLDSLTIFYIVESILEGYSPFGPGSSSFLFWLLASYADMEAYDLESDIDMRLNEGGFKEYEWK